jgi:hypothetical protein
MQAVPSGWLSRVPPQALASQFVSSLCRAYRVVIIVLPHRRGIDP